MYDTVVYRALPRARRRAAGRPGGAGPAAARRRHRQRARPTRTRDWSAAHGPASVVGVMGGHAVPRGSRAVPDWPRSWAGELARAGRLVVTGGGPGRDGGGQPRRVPRRPAAGRADRRDRPAGGRAGLPRPRPRTRRRRWPSASRFPAPRPAAATGPRAGGLAIPTWLYGHEPANLFAGRIAKYFSNAIREDTILRLARGGIVFAPGRAGTVQEVFQAATKTFYGTDGASGPFVFLDRDVLDRGAAGRGAAAAAAGRVAARRPVRPGARHRRRPARPSRLLTA